MKRASLWIPLLAATLSVSIGCENLDLPFPGDDAGDTPTSTATEVKAAPPEPAPAPPPEPQEVDASQRLTAIRNVPSFQVTDDQLVALSQADTGLDTVTELNLAGARLTAKGLAAIATLPELRTLNLNSCSIQPADWNALSPAVQLERLDLSKSTMDSKSLAALSDMTELKYLNLTDSRVSDVGFVHLAKLSALEEIHLSSLNIEGSGMEALGRKGANAPLRIIEAANTNFGYLGFVHVADFNDLRELNASGSTVTDLSLAGLKGMSALERLVLSNNQITDEGLKQLADCENLVVLTLDGIRTISDVGLKRLSKFRHLEELRINDSFCTAEGIQEFKKRLPDCRVRLQNRKF